MTNLSDQVAELESTIDRMEEAIRDYETAMESAAMALLLLPGVPVRNLGTEIGRIIETLSSVRSSVRQENEKTRYFRYSTLYYRVRPGEVPGVWEAGGWEKSRMFLTSAELVFDDDVEEIEAAELPEGAR